MELTTAIFYAFALVLVLSGVVIGALAGACISLVKILADPYDQLPAITFWLLGSLAGVKLADLAVTAPLVLLGVVPLFPRTFYYCEKHRR